MEFRGRRSRLRILAVDDDARSLETLEFFLEVDGHEIYTASRGHEAVSVARRLKRERKRVDLSILDYHMPDQTGIDTYLQLSSELPGLGAIFVTGEVSETVARGISEVGGLALVPKPVDLIRMRSVLDEFRQKLLGGCRVEREVAERDGTERDDGGCGLTEE